MARRELTEINAGSMADIAFLLLIFFLVTTTMSTNTGMQRKLPPWPEDDKKDEIIDVHKRNIMAVLINKDNFIMVNGVPKQLSNITEDAKEFLENKNRREDLPEFESKEIPVLGVIPVSKGIISLQTDRTTVYEKYLQVQNELIRAVTELRDERSMKEFGVHFEDLEDDKKVEAISKAIPLAISEAEPRRKVQK